MRATQVDRREDSTRQRTPTDDLADRICKLRWMGMEDEAKSLQTAFRRLQPSGSVLATPLETD
jgi:hypothetical protein